MATSVISDLITLSKGVVAFKEDGRPADTYERIPHVSEFKFTQATETLDVKGSEGPTVDSIAKITKSIDITGSFVCKVPRADIMRFFGASKKVDELSQSSTTWTNQSFTVYKGKMTDLKKINLTGVKVKKAGVTFTAATTDIITSNAHGLEAGDTVNVISGTTLPAGLTAGTLYYVLAIDANTFKLSLEENGTAVDITDTGSGTHSFLRVFKENIDYILYADAGMIDIIYEGDIADASAILIDATVPAAKTYEVEIGTKPQIVGDLKFLGRPVNGVAQNFTAYVKISPDGDLGLVTDAEQTFTLKFEVIKKNNVLAKWVDRSGKSFSVAAVA